MTATLRCAAALLGSALAAACASAGPYVPPCGNYCSPVFKCLLPAAPDLFSGGFYYIAPNGQVCGPNYYLRPPVSPFNGAHQPQYVGQILMAKKLGMAPPPFSHDGRLVRPPAGPGGASHTPPAPPPLGCGPNPFLTSMSPYGPTDSGWMPPPPAQMPAPQGGPLPPPVYQPGGTPPMWHQTPGYAPPQTPARLAYGWWPTMPVQLAQATAPILNPAAPMVPGMPPMGFPPNMPPPNVPPPGFAPPMPIPGYNPALPTPAYNPNLPAPAYNPNLPVPGYTPNLPVPGYTPNLPVPSYTPNLPNFSIPVYGAPTKVQTAFPYHPYVRSPRDFFMWRENMEDQVMRQTRPALVP